MKALILFLTCLLPMSLSAAPSKTAGPKLIPITCRADLNSKMLSVTSLPHKVVLSAISVEPKASCQIIEYGKYRFLQVNYRAKETLSYSNKVELSQQIEIFDLNANNRTLVSQEIGNDVIVWSIEQNHLLGRIQSKQKGKSIWLNGYIYDPDRKQFIDYQVFAKNKGWNYQE